MSATHFLLRGPHLCPGSFDRVPLHLIATPCNDPYASLLNAGPSVVMHTGAAACHIPLPLAGDSGTADRLLIAAAP